jgi:hypothetical protein
MYGNTQSRGALYHNPLSLPGRLDSSISEEGEIYYGITREWVEER